MLKFMLIGSVLAVGSQQIAVDEAGELRISPSGNQNQPAGESFAMHCNKGAGEGSYTKFGWFGPQGQEITSDSGLSSAISTFPSENGLVLMFDKPTPENSGKYTCKARYSNTNLLQSDVKVTFFHDITFDDCPLVQNLVKERDGTIRCNVHGNPVPKLYWKKSVQISLVAKYSLQGSHLNVRNVEDSDAGRYEVTALVEATGKIKKKHIIVNVLTVPKVDSFLPGPVNEGEPRTVLCPASGVPPPLCYWTDFNGRNLSSVAHFRVNPEACTLDFVQASRDHDGNYTCWAVNPAGTASQTVHVAVHVPPRVVEFKNVVVDELDVARLECEVEGEPAPEISIRKEGDARNLENDRSVRSERFAARYKKTLRVTIDNTSRERAGLYYCRAESNGVHVERAGHVEVHFLPLLRAKENPVYAWQNRDAMLSCHVEAIPNATIEWRDAKGGMLLEPGLFAVENSAGVSVLRIRDDADRYEREFVCNAVNALGEARLPFQVLEARRPSSPGLPRLIHSSATTISFVFDKPVNDGGMPILEYAVKYWRRSPVQGEVETKIFSEMVGKHMTIGRLQPRSEYAFVFSARSEVGEGPMSGEWIVNTTAEAPPERPVITSSFPGSVLVNRVHIEWAIPLDNGKPIEFFKVYYQQVERTSPVEVRALGHKKSLTIKVGSNLGAADLRDLKPDTLYEISVVAHNAMGPSEPGSIVLQTAQDIRFLGFPEGATEGLHANIGTPLLVTLIALACLVLLVVVDVLCYFHFRMGLLYALRHLICAKPSQGVYSKTGSSQS